MRYWNIIYGKTKRPAVRYKGSLKGGGAKVKGLKAFKNSADKTAVKLEIGLLTKKHDPLSNLTLSHV